MNNSFNNFCSFKNSCSFKNFCRTVLIGSLLGFVVHLEILSESIHAKERVDQLIFSRAYLTEKTSLFFAAEMYEHALQQKLSPNLEKATRWRLFLLYKKFGRYSLAYSQLLLLRKKGMAGKQSDSLLAKIVPLSAQKWNTNLEWTTEYFRLLEDDWAAQSSDQRHEIEKRRDHFFREEISQVASRTKFLNEWVEVYVVAKRNVPVATRIVSLYSDTATLDCAEIFVRQGKINLAFEKLREAERKFEVRKHNQIKKNYLFGIIYRERSNFSKSNRYFYRALQQSPRSNRFVYYELLAYNHFLQDNILGALDTLDSAKKPKSRGINNDAYFLYLLLEKYRYTSESDQRSKIPNHLSRQFKNLKSYLEYRMEYKPNKIIREAWKVAQGIE